MLMSKDELMVEIYVSGIFDSSRALTPASVLAFEAQVIKFCIIKHDAKSY